MPRPYTITEDAEIVRLKERVAFKGWSNLAAAFNENFAPSAARPWGTMQVRYSRYLAVGKKHRRRAVAALAATTTGLHTNFFLSLLLLLLPTIHPQTAVHLCREPRFKCRTNADVLLADPVVTSALARPRRGVAAAPPAGE